jgi:hypothetical protein
LTTVSALSPLVTKNWPNIYETNEAQPFHCHPPVTPHLCVLTSSTGEVAVKGANQKRLEVRVKPFVDLYFFVYKLSSTSDIPPEIKGFPEAVDAARQIPFTATLVDLIPFQCETAVDAVRAFSQFPETYKTAKGEIIPLRERAVHLARALAVIEKPFLKKVWPQHKRDIEQAAARVAQTLGPKEQECFTYLTKHLGMEDAEYVVPIYLVAETPWPGGFTMWGKESTHGICLLSVRALQGSKLLGAILHEAIHALDLETRGNGNVLQLLNDRLLKAGFDKSDLVVKLAPHLLVFIQSAETVRRYLDPSHHAYDEGVFARPGLQPVVRVELPIWTAYLDGKMSREDALNQIVDEFIKARKDAPHPLV